jgi:hypothetical protein
VIRLLLVVGLLAFILFWFTRVPKSAVLPILLPSEAQLPSLRPAIAGSAPILRNNESPRNAKLSVEEMIKSDALCSFLTESASGGMRFPVLYTVWHQGFRSKDFDALLEEKGPLFGVYRESNDKVLKFFNALLISGLLVISESTDLPLDYKKGARLFAELEREDPGNGAYPFFRLAAEWQLNPDPKLAEELIGLASRKKTFETFLPPLSAEIRHMGWINPTFFSASLMLNAALSIPDFSVTTKIIRESLVPSGCCVVALKSLAHLMTTEGNNAVQGMETNGFSAVQYQTGVSYLKMVAPKEAAHTPNFMELSARKPLAKRAREWFNVDWSALSDTNHCDRAGWENWFYTFRDIF